MFSRSSHSHTKHQLHILFQKQSFTDTLQDQRSLKNIEIHLGAAMHLLKHKKYIQKQLHKSSRFLHKIYTLCVKIFYNLSMVLKTSMMDGLKSNGLA